MVEQLWQFAVRVVIGSFQIVSYVFIYSIQAIWFKAAGRGDKVPEALGTMARGVVDVIAATFRR